MKNCYRLQLDSMGLSELLSFACEGLENRLKRAQSVAERSDLPISSNVVRLLRGQYAELLDLYSFELKLEKK